MLIKKLFVLVSISAVAYCNTVSAQISQENRAAIISAITTLLLLDSLPSISEPEGLRVNLDLGQRDLQTYIPDSTVYAAFEPQKQAVELCFDLSSADAIASGDIQVLLNDTQVSFEMSKDNCFVLQPADNFATNYVVINVVNPAVSVNIDRFELASVNQTRLTLPKLTRGGWNEEAVRKVLKVFAFGGQALDSQIRDWADMDADVAIAEMLNFDEHNLKLSATIPCDSDSPCETYTDTQTNYGTLRSFVNWFSDTASNTPVPTENRQYFGIDSYRFEEAFLRFVLARGLNPFRQRIGFWETNYHLAVNLDVGVSRDQVTEYYDVIMNAHASGIPYHEVLGVAAKAAAVATQYGHDENQWNPFTQECECNEDFAREIHQLYYGIFGASDPNHEDVTIPETAKMLTDMRVGQDGASPTHVVFETEFHHANPVTIFGQTVSGANAAAKIDALMPVSIEHEEALNNLPVMIISGLADDNLTEAKRSQLRVAWASMGNKDFLEFIRSYAVSTLFHDDTQVKYFTTFERALYLGNKFNLDNFDALMNGDYVSSGRGGYDTERIVRNEFASEVFRPLHNVFGGQSAAEASDSQAILEHNFNMIVDRTYLLYQPAYCDDCDQGAGREKKWQAVLPRRADGEFYVEDVAKWLWVHVVGNDRNYTELERAHLYSILGAVRRSPDQTWDESLFFDFNLLMCMVDDYLLQENQTTVTIDYLMTNGRHDNYCRVDNDGGDSYTEAELATLNKGFTSAEISANPLTQQLLAELGAKTIPLLATDGTNSGRDRREHARERIHYALAFIFTSPYVFAEAK